MICRKIGMFSGLPICVFFPQHKYSPLIIKHILVFYSIQSLRIRKYREENVGHDVQLTQHDIFLFIV